MSTKFTPWFIPSEGELPVRSGVYNVSCQEKNQSGGWFSYVEVQPTGELKYSKSWGRSIDKAVAYAAQYGFTNEPNFESWRGIEKE